MFKESVLGWPVNIMNPVHSVQFFDIMNAVGLVGLVLWKRRRSESVVREDSHWAEDYASGTLHSSLVEI